MASRGCPNACSYCCHCFLRKLYEGRGDRVRYRSVQNVINELQIAKSRGMKGVTFDDDVFIFNIGWLREFAPLYAQQVGLPCFCWMYPPTVTRESADLLQLMNCQCVDMGVQTLTPRTRQDCLHRFYKNEVVERAISLLNERKMVIIADQIWGLPGEGEEDYIKALDFYSYHRADKIFIFYLRHYPRLEINRQAGLSEARLEAIRQDTGSRPFSLGGDYATPKLRRLECVTVLLQVLPGCLVRLVLRWRLYRFFPAINPTGLSVLVLWLKLTLVGRWRISTIFFRRPFKHVHALRKLISFRIKQQLTRTHKAP